MTNTFKKLNLKDQKRILVVNSPGSFESEIAGLSGVEIVREVKAAKGISFALAFVSTKKELDALAAAIARNARGDAVVWFAYPKRSSKKYKSEIDRDSGWQVLGELGFEGVRQVSIDEDWSALRFRRVEFIGKMKRDPSRAMTRQGRAKVAEKARKAFC